jgi:two-component system, cell cycle response regulator
MLKDTMPPQDRNPSRSYEDERDDHDDRTIVKGAGFAAKASPQPQQAYLIVLNGSSAGKMYKIVGDEMIIGRSANADILLTDDSVSRNHARICRVGHALQVSDLGSTNGTYCNGDLISTHVLNDGDKVQVGSSIILKFSYQDNLEEQYLKQLYESATKDGLTDVYNKKYFLNQLNYEFSFAQRKGVPLSLIVFDLDKFKLINDNYGHLAGDAILKHVSRVVSSRIRSHDLFARYGGEEFVLLLRETDDQAAAMLAERMRRQIEQNKIQYEGQTIPVTISAGVASTVRRVFQTPAQLIDVADMALYRSKQNGRNRITLAWEVPDERPEVSADGSEQRGALPKDDLVLKTHPVELPQPGREIPAPPAARPDGVRELGPTTAIKAQPPVDERRPKSNNKGNTRTPPPGRIVPG